MLHENCGKTNISNVGFALSFCMQEVCPSASRAGDPACVGNADFGGRIWIFDVRIAAGTSC